MVLNLPELNADENIIFPFMPPRHSHSHITSSQASDSRAFLKIGTEINLVLTRETIIS